MKTAAAETPEAEMPCGPLKIGVIGANGKSGSLIAREAAARGHDVTAVVRRDVETPAGRALVRDVFDLTAGDLAGFDAVVDAFGTSRPEDLPLHKRHLEHLASILAGTATRLVVVGSAGSLYIDGDHTTRVLESPQMPEQFKPVASAMADGLDCLRTRGDVAWTYVSPPLDFRADGERTGSYILAGEEFTLNSNGESAMSYADYAIGLIDEIEAGKHVRERISLLS